MINIKITKNNNNKGINSGFIGKEFWDLLEMGFVGFAMEGDWLVAGFMIMAMKWVLVFLWVG